MDKAQSAKLKIDLYENSDSNNCVSCFLLDYI